MLTAEAAHIGSQTESHSPAINSLIMLLSARIVTGRAAALHSELTRMVTRTEEVQPISRTVMAYALTGLHAVCPLAGTVMFAPALSLNAGRLDQEVMVTSS